MAVNNLVVGATIVNHKGLRGVVEIIESNAVTIELESGEKKVVSKALIARWWKDDEREALQEAPKAEDEVAICDEQVEEHNNMEEQIEAVVEEDVADNIVENEEAQEVVEEEPKKEKKAKKEKPVKTEDEILAEKAEKERVKKEREEQRKAQYEENKIRMSEMRDWITSLLAERYPELVLKQNTTYVAVRYSNRVTMEVHYRGESCNLYILPQGEDFIESELFNRKDGSKAWIVNQGYEVPVQKTEDIAEEIVRLFEASKKIVDDKAEAKRLETLRKKAEKQAKSEKMKEERNLKRAQAKKDKERLKAMMEAQAKEAQGELAQAPMPQEESVSIEEENEEVF